MYSLQLLSLSVSVFLHVAAEMQKEQSLLRGIWLFLFALVENLFDTSFPSMTLTSFFASASEVIST